MSGTRWRINAYDEWLAGEGVPIVGGLAVDPLTVETKPWPRFGMNACIVHLDARGDFCDLHLMDVPPGGASEPIRHVYEALVYVLEGRGSTELSLLDGTKRQFEWGKGSLFATPLNVRYQHFNASGNQRARLAYVTDLPLIMKLYRNERFVFDTEFDFTERFSDPRQLRGEGVFHEVREHRHQWETNLVPDLLTFEHLTLSNGRGKGSTNIQFVIGDGSLHAHMSEIPVGNYKKAHRHGDGLHIFQLGGRGYSLYWWDDEQEPERVDWSYGMLHSPQSGQWHQHFNISDEPARYMAMGFGSIRYPILREKEIILDRDYRTGGDYQIEYEDEDPRIRKTFDTSCAAWLAEQG
jgi:uncharacterized RmlC-like cupin family protein